MEVTRKRQIRADLALLLMTLIWGSTFVMVKDAVTNYPVFPFLALRFGMATLILLVVGVKRLRNLTWRKLAAGIVVGLLLFAGYSFQTIGLQYTSASKAGFITGLSVVIVPVLSMLFWKHKPSLAAIFGVLLAMVGLASLTLNERFNIGYGDLIVLGCAFSYALHIISIGLFAPRIDPIALSIVQIATVTVACTIATFVTGVSWLMPTGPVWFASGFTGLLATALAFGVQTSAQRFTTSTHTALIFVAEPVFAAVFGVLLAGDVLTGRILAGGVLIVVGMIISELEWTGHTAYLISRFLAPQYVAVPVILVMALSDTLPWYNALLWAAGICLLALPLPLLLLQRELRIGRISDWHVKNRLERLQPRTIFIILFAVLVPLAAMIIFHGPRLLLMTLIGTTVMSVFNLLVTIRWKISQHVSGVAFASVLMASILGIGALPVLLIIPIVAWARVRLGAHTLAQTIAGGLAGTGVAIAMMGIFHVI